MRLTKYALLIAAASMFSACATDTATGNEEEQQVPGANTNSLVVGLTSFDLETGLSSGGASTASDDFFILHIDVPTTAVRTLRAATLIRKWGPVSGLAELVGTVLPPTGWSSDAVGAEIVVNISDGFWIETDTGTVYAIYVKHIEKSVIFTFDWAVVG